MAVLGLVLRAMKNAFAISYADLTGLVAICYISIRALTSKSQCWA